MKENDNNDMAAVDVTIGENDAQTCIGPLGGNAWMRDGQRLDQGAPSGRCRDTLLPHPRTHQSPNSTTTGSVETGLVWLCLQSRHELSLQYSHSTAHLGSS